MIVQSVDIFALLGQDERLSTWQAKGKAMSGWYYQKKGILSDDQVGPLTDQALAQLLDTGAVGPDTLVLHPQKTRGQWSMVRHLSPLMQRWQTSHDKREKAKAEARAAEEANKQAQQQLIAEQRRAAVNNPSQPTGIQRFLQHGQSPAAIEAAQARLANYITAQEEIQYIAVQANPLSVTPDTVALTNRRLIIIERKLLGQMNMVDYVWLDLFDARLQEGVMYATLWFQVAGRSPFKIDYLPKEQGRMLYRIAQEREEAMREFRRQRSMEETRAGASQITINNSSGASPSVSPHMAVPQIPQGHSPPLLEHAPAKDDPMTRLQKAKSMLEAGLIEQAEFESIRQKILSDL